MPVSTAYIYAVTGTPMRTLRRYLLRLERLGHVDRPWGERKGWALPSVIPRYRQLTLPLCWERTPAGVGAWAESMGMRSPPPEPRQMSLWDLN